MTVRALASLPVLVAVLLSAAVASATPFAYIGNGNVPGSFTVIDVATNTIVTQVSIGDESNCCHGPRAVAVSPSGDRAYLALANMGGIAVLDTATNTMLPSIPTPGRNPQALAVNSAGTRLYAAAYQDTGGGGIAASVVFVFDMATNALLDTISVPAGPRGIVVSSDGTRVYTANVSANSVTTIDATTDTVLGSVPIPNGPFGAAMPSDVVVTPDGSRLYVTKSNTFEIVVIDTATNTILHSVNTENGPLGITINAAGTRVYVGHNDSPTIKVIDTATDTVVASIPVQGQGGLSLTPDGTRLYANRTNFPAAVNVVDTATNTLITSISGIRPFAYGSFIGPICPSACNDGNPCTTDGCSNVSGCIYTNNTNPCASDGNPCTDDVCDGAGTCGHANSASGATCSDGTFCNGTDTCDGAGGCTNHAGDPCAGGPECAATCDEAADNCFDPISTACSSDGNVCTDDHCNASGACVHTSNTAPCDDGLFCNGTDTCAASACTHAGDPCAGGPECAVVCNEGADNCFDPSGTACTADTNPCTLDQCDGAGACGHPAGNAGAVCRASVDQCDATETCTGASTICPPDGDVPNGTACTDGDPCTTGEACTAGACGGGIPAPAGCVDHYLCYKSKVTSGTTHFVALPGVALADPLETAAATVQKPKAICPPADKNGEGIHDAATHEESYQIKSDVKHVPHTNLIVTDQFGTLHVDTVKAERLLVPTAKGLGSPPAGPPAPGAADHYKCYRVKLSLGAPKFPKGVQANVVDQLQTRTYDIRSPRHLCVPVDKYGEGIEHPLAHLMCYQVKPAKGQPKHVRVVGQIHTDNQFGTGRLDTIKEDELCVPATRTP